MRAYLAFTKKELLENLRTYKLLIMIITFVFLGILSPLTAKLLPDILEKFSPEGMQVLIKESTVLDSWAQFFKNISQLGLIIVTILFSSMMSNEFNQGTFVNILTKGLARRTIILSKFSVASLVWTFSYFISFSLSYGYTAYYWTNEGVSNLLPSVSYLWLFGILLLAIIILGGALFKSNYASLMFTGAFVLLLFLLNILPKLEKYNPIRLASANMSLLTADIRPKDLRSATIVSIGIIILSVITAIRVFNKKEI